MQVYVLKIINDAILLSNIDYDGFSNSLILTDEVSLRTLEVIKIGLSEMEGISWVRC